MPQVTVIIAALNQEKYIGRCIRSLIAQNFPRTKYEIIVVDDGSSDRTSYALELFQDEIQIIKNESNLGLPASLNSAIKKIRTPFFVRVDADDYVSRNFLLYLYEFATNNTYMDAIACDYNMVDDSGAIMSRNDCMQKPIACGILFRTDQIINIGLYDEKFLAQEEQDLRIRFLSKYKVYRLELPLYRYRRHESNMTKDTEKMNHYKNELIIKHGKDIVNNDD
jgi:glycosyltransferase involved in cell wall biosynthesis